jgi:tetratricopeptide (TPR) repeat protein
MFFGLFVWAVAAPASANTDPETLPMFGEPEITRGREAKQADEVFIKNMIAKFGNRDAASDAAVARGWEAFHSGAVMTALRRFNEGWLLAPYNPGVFWGFGAVLSDQGKLSKAIEQLETARELISGDDKQWVQLLCDIGAVRSAYAAGLPRERELERAHQFSLANQRFTESLQLDPDYAPSWREWALSLYDQERYQEAALKAARARELKAGSFPADFLRKLNSKITQPK